MRTVSQLLSLALLTGSLPASVGAADLGTKRTLTLEIARAITLAAEQKATANGWAMVVAVLDDGGNLIDLERMDGSPMGSIEVAQKKARTAVRFKAPSKDFADGMSKGNSALLALDVLPFEGGIPIVANGQVIGAIGVSGGTAEQDGQAAAAGINWFNANIAKK
jgi:glc operon protein GlcG